MQLGGQKVVFAFDRTRIICLFCC